MKKAPNRTNDTGALGEQLTLIEPPEFCPTWPNRGSLSYRALNMFLAGQAFDHPDFLEGCGSWRLAAVVFQLRALGWPIDTLQIPAPSEEHTGRTIALYKLPAKYAAQALATMKGAVQ